MGKEVVLVYAVFAKYILFLALISLVPAVILHFFLLFVAKGLKKTPPCWSKVYDHWWAGYNLGQIRNKTEFVKERLARRAANVGLFGSFQPEPPLSADQVYQYKESDAYVWLLVRKDDGGAE